jgi:transposase
MDYPLAVAEKAKRLEQLLQRVAAGERLAEMNEELDFNLDEKQLAQAQAKYEAGGGQWEALVDGRYGHPQKVHSGIREWLYRRKEKDQAVRAPQLAREIKAKFAVEVEPGHLNYLLRKRGLTASPGHPPKPETGDQEREAGSAPGESLDNAPLFTADGTGQDGRPTGLSNSAHDRDRTKTFIQVQATHPEA